MVRHDLRYTVDQALADPFFNISLDKEKESSATLRRDLCDLEEKVKREERIRREARKI